MGVVNDVHGPIDPGRQLPESAPPSALPLAAPLLLLPLVAPLDEDHAGLVAIDQGQSRR